MFIIIWGFFFAYFWICIDFNSANQCVAVNFNSITLNTLNYLARAHNQNMICAKKNLHKIFVVRFDVFNVGFSFIVMGRKRHKKTHFTTFLFFFYCLFFPSFDHTHISTHTSTHNCIRSIRSRRISRFLLFLFFNSRWTQNSGTAITLSHCRCRCFFQFMCVCVAFFLFIWADFDFAPFKCLFRYDFNTFPYVKI